MRLSIVAVGRLKPGAERELSERYAERVRQLATTTGLKLWVREIPESKKSRPQDRRDDEGNSLTAALAADAVVIALDAAGAELTSEALAGRIADWRDRSTAELAFVIGGADGLSEAIVARADLVLSFGRITWPHQLVRGMLSEQIYRVMTIIAGHPYHRA
jgi:23S rRNA (pseudouridine1915-N3)-methyltransferase